MPLAIDFGPLSDQVAGPPPMVLRQREQIRLGALYAVIAVTLLSMGLGIGALTWSPYAADHNGGFTVGFPSSLVLLSVGLLLIAIMVGTIVATVLYYRSKRVWMPQLASRLPAFAAANHLLFSRRDSNPEYPGTLFAVGNDRVALDHLRSTSGRYFDLGSYHFTVSAGSSAALLKWGFIAIQLDRRLPHMLMEATGHRGWANGGVPISIDRTQSISLEGDFDSYFTLYAPKDYESDARYVFAPDLMALLIDETTQMHVEIVDDWLFVYSSVDFDGASLEDYQRYFRIIEVVGAKTLRQTDRYEDDRLQQASVPAAERVVAADGRRLRNGRLSPFGRAMAPVYIAMAVVIVVIVVIANLAS
ncbi:MAG: hypothetical protein ABJA94_08815 [Rhodoglobus sp.]